MGNPGFNLANRSPAERLAVAADLEACRLIHGRKHQGQAWRAWVNAELAKLNHPELVRAALNSRLGIGK